MTAITQRIDAITRAITPARATIRRGVSRALASSKPPELWLALILAVAAAAPTQARAETVPAAGELDTIASVMQGDYRYELTNFTCAREARLQAEGATSKRARTYGQWLAQQPAGSKSMTVRVGSAYNGGGCYERIPGGIRVYVQGRGQPRDVIAPLVPVEPLATDLQSVPPVVPAVPAQSGQPGRAAAAAVATTSPQLKPAPMPEYPHTSAISDLLRAHLESAPPGMREDFLFENRPATMWRLTCKQIAQFQSGMANTDKDRAFVAWQATAPGNLLTVLRVDGSTSQSCYEPTTRGIRIFGKGQQPFDSNWR